MTISGFKILHLDLGMEFRGGQRQVLYLASAQHKDGWDVTVCAPHGAAILDRARELRLNILPLPGRYDFDLRNIRYLCRQADSATMLHTHDARSASLGALCKPWIRHVIHTRRVSYALGRGWSRAKYLLGSLVVCVSREVESVVKQAGVKNTAVVPSAIDVGRYTLRNQDNNGRIGIIGALSPQKGHAQFFQALTLLDSVPEIWVVGTGALEGELRRLADQLSLGSRIHWQGHVESAAMLPELDILVVPSVHGEGSSGVIKEGWAAGVPVLCSDLEANLELVTADENGLVFRNGDPASLARQLLRLACDRALCHQLVDAGLTSVATYDIPQMHHAYQRIYRQLISS